MKKRNMKTINNNRDSKKSTTISKSIRKANNQNKTKNCKQTKS